MANGYAQLVSKIKVIAGLSPTFMSDAEKLQRIQAEIADHEATQEAQRTAYERQLLEMEKELATT